MDAVQARVPVSDAVEWPVTGSAGPSPARLPRGVPSGHPLQPSFWQTQDMVQAVENVPRHRVSTRGLAIAAVVVSITALGVAVLSIDRHSASRVPTPTNV